MLWNPTSYLQSCIQIEAELALSLFQLQICIFKVLSTSTWSATAVQIFYFDVCWHAIKQIIWILACFGVIQHSFLEVGEQGMQGRKGGGPSATCRPVQWCIAVGWTATVSAVCCCSVCHGIQGTSTPSSSLQVPRSPPPCATHLLLHWFS